MAPLPPASVARPRRAATSRGRVAPPCARSHDSIQVPGEHGCAHPHASAHPDVHPRARGPHLLACAGEPRAESFLRAAARAAAVFATTACLSFSRAAAARPVLCSGWSRITRRNRQRPNGMRFEAGASACCEHQCPPRLLHPSSSERVLLVSLQALVLKLSSGDYFGEIALLSGKPRQASVKAVGQVTLLVMSRDAFTRLCGNLFGNYIPPPWHIANSHSYGFCAESR